MTEPLLFCKDCRHFDVLDRKCNAPQNTTEPSLVSGSTVSFNSPSYLRRGGWLSCRLMQSCGREGRWFKPKEDSK